MSKDKKSRNVATANDIEATKGSGNWKDMCDNCEFLRIDNDCIFGCEFIKDSLKRRQKK
ncbi:MAG: hypothetical protein JSV56_11155 [Methanomassiliicoccales archaeon]|nr:MAG: hypothetical protein JSV56_11155 [Methanomassiliicoccales archaeon]